MLPDLGGDPEVAIKALKAVGIAVVEIPDDTLPAEADTAQPLLPYDFQNSIAKFFKGVGAPAPISSLADVVAINNQDPANRAPYGQHFVEWLVETKMTDAEYQRILTVARALAAHWMKSVIEKNDVDVLITGMGYSGNAGAAGVPALTIPAGLDPKGRPQGVILSGPHLSEPKLFAVGYALEQALKGRVEPDLDVQLTVWILALQGLFLGLMVLFYGRRSLGAGIVSQARDRQMVAEFERMRSKPSPVPGGGYASRAFAAATDELRVLRANPWQWVSFEGSAGRYEIGDPASYRATFNTAASLAIAADCNNAAGSYQGEGGDLTIEIGPVTLADCGQESRSQQFIELLTAGVCCTFEGQNLRIEVAWENSSATMVFAPTDEAVVGPEKASEAVTPASLADSLGNLSYNDILPNQPVTLIDRPGTTEHPDSAVTEISVYNLGDGGAMSGFRLAGRRAETGEATFLLD